MVEDPAVPRKLHTSIALAVSVWVGAVPPAHFKIPPLIAHVIAPAVALGFCTTTRHVLPGVRFISVSVTAPVPIGHAI